MGWAAFATAIDGTGIPAVEAGRVRNDVRELRTERGLSQGALAVVMGVSRQTINSIEADRYTPSLPLAIALAKFFDQPVEDIFHANGTP